LDDGGAGAGTTRGRKSPITLAGRYTLRWADYALVEGQRFRYLNVDRPVLTADGCDA
jgi:hypothetical protein